MFLSKQVGSLIYSIMRFWRWHPPAAWDHHKTSKGDPPVRRTSRSPLGSHLDSAFNLMLNTNIGNQASETSERHSCTCEELMTAETRTSRAAWCQGPESTNEPDHPLLHLCLPSLKTRPLHLQCALWMPQTGCVAAKPWGQGPYWAGPRLRKDFLPCLSGHFADAGCHSPSWSCSLWDGRLLARSLPWQSHYRLQLLDLCPLQSSQPQMLLDSWETIAVFFCVDRSQDLVLSWWQQIRWW